jgi:hypothetical protein
MIKYGNRRKWFPENIAAEAKKYKTRGEFWNNAPSACVASAKKLGIFEEVCAHMVDGRADVKRKWFPENIAAEAKKYSTRSDFINAVPSAYNAAQKYGIFEQICSHMKKSREGTAEKLRIHSYESVIEAAKASDSMADFKRKYPKKFIAASNNGWYKECTQLVKNKPVFYSNEDLKNIAAQCKTSDEFRLKNDSAYTIACSRGILQDICTHMEAKKIEESDTVYIWKAEGQYYNGNQVYKIGVSRFVRGSYRITRSSTKSGFKATIVAMVKVNCRAVNLEKQIMRIGDNPQYIGFDGCTEFRAMSDEQLNIALQLLNAAADNEIKKAA